MGIKNYKPTSAGRRGMSVNDFRELRGERGSPYVAEGKRIYFVIHLEDGKCTDYHETDEAPPRKEFDFIFEFPASVFEGVAAGTVDPPPALSRFRLSGLSQRTAGGSAL